MPAFLLAGILGITLWLAATCIIWRETAGERAERIRRGARDRMFCPRCGYNMTGLRESRCPECGTVFTLDELFAAQHAEPIADASEPARPSSC